MIALRAAMYFFLGASLWKLRGMRLLVMTSGCGHLKEQGMCLSIISPQELRLRGPEKETPLYERECPVRVICPAEMEDWPGVLSSDRLPGHPLIQSPWGDIHYHDIRNQGDWAGLCLEIRAGHQDLVNRVTQATLSWQGKQWFWVWAGRSIFKKA